MKILLSILFFAGIFVYVVACHGSDVPPLVSSIHEYYVDFDKSMQRAHYSSNLKYKEQQDRYNLFKKLYEKNSFTKMVPQIHALIPRVINWVWLGSPFPEKYRAFQESWKKHHPGWEFRVWTDADFKTFPLYNRALYESSKNYGEKSDIVRYEILYQLGGLYVDIDMECLKSLDVLHFLYDFYIAIQPLDTSHVQVGNYIIGSVAGHPLLKRIIEGMAANVRTARDSVVDRTGPLYFTRVFCKIALQLNSRLIALPASYLSPKSYAQKDDTTNVWVRPESFAVHHWEASWLKPEAFVARAL